MIFSPARLHILTTIVHVITPWFEQSTCACRGVPNGALQIKCRVSEQLANKPEISRCWQNGISIRCWFEIWISKPTRKHLQCNRLVSSRAVIQQSSNGSRHTCFHLRMVESVENTSLQLAYKNGPSRERARMSKEAINLRPLFLCAFRGGFRKSP